MKNSISIRSTPALMLVLLPLVSGCDECFDGSCCGDGWHDAPRPPVGVHSITGDGQVTLRWLDSQDAVVHGYRVYVSEQPDGPYDEIGETRRLTFIDYGARNGHTYFYAVASFDDCGNESDLSYEDVFDTPRPEGSGLVLRNAEIRPADSGYDFSEFRVQDRVLSDTDIYFINDGGIARMNAASPQTRLQDMGYMPIEDLDRAPEAGWSTSGRVELIRGHTYAVFTGDGYFAKFEVTDLTSDRVTLDWAFQIDRGNRELSIQPPVAAGTAASTLRAKTGGAAAES